MISLVLQHLENLHGDLMAIDPAHRTDAADRVADLAVQLRRILSDATDASARTTASPKIAAREAA